MAYNEGSLTAGIATENEVMDGDRVSDAIGLCGFSKIHYSSRRFSFLAIESSHPSFRKSAARRHKEMSGVAARFYPAINLLIDFCGAVGSEDREWWNEEGKRRRQLANSGGYAYLLIAPAMEITITPEHILEAIAQSKHSGASPDEHQDAAPAPADLYGQAIEVGGVSDTVVKIDGNSDVAAVRPSL